MGHWTFDICFARYHIYIIHVFFHIWKIGRKKTKRERKRKIHLWFNNIQIMRHVYCLKYKYVQVSHSNTWIHYMMEDDPQWVERGAVSPNREQSIQLYGLWVWGSSLSIRSAISSFVECPMFSRPVFWIVLCS